MVPLSLYAGKKTLRPGPWLEGLAAHPRNLSSRTRAGAPARTRPWRNTSRQGVNTDSNRMPEDSFDAPPAARRR